jgi:hypothetical protein
MEEIAMGLPLRSLSRSGFVVAVFLPLTIAATALASQGPGGARGTASASTQVLMAIVVYGGAAVIVATRLVGALLKRRS